MELSRYVGDCTRGCADVRVPTDRFSTTTWPDHGSGGGAYRTGGWGSAARAVTAVLPAAGSRCSAHPVSCGGSTRPSSAEAGGSAAARQTTRRR